MALVTRAIAVINLPRDEGVVDYMIRAANDLKIKGEIKRIGSETDLNPMVSSKHKHFLKLAKLEIKDGNVAQLDVQGPNIYRLACFLASCYYLGGDMPRTMHLCAKFTPMYSDIQENSLIVVNHDPNDFVSLNNNLKYRERDRIYYLTLLSDAKVRYGDITIESMPPNSQHIMVE
ncbi:hypothetical protein AKO1_012940 [Acrasis kona]|uniref:Uncharacterized protein n=1 Tax=Acrasis kona TaxID=1008807 RepID=A0AAW2YXX1_9EUKA